MRDLTTLLFLFIPLALGLAACGSTPADGDGGAAGEDAGRRRGRDSGRVVVEEDAGRRMTMDCGEVADMCCDRSPRCVQGARCGTDGQCCSIPGGAECSAPSDCCGTLDCVAGACCAPETSPCRDSSDCCGGLICSEFGACERTSTECGGEGAECCDGDACRSGLECFDGICLPCGDDGETCCKPPGQCGEGLVCGEEGRCEDAPAACGALDQACCDGERCSGELTCMDGACTPPPSDCSFLSCNECTRNFPCGWCGSTGSCTEGTPTGPETGSCGDWTWVASECSGMDPCEAAGSCGDCTSTAGCGFCGDTSDCQRGSSTGPAAGSCTDWRWVPNDCTPGNRCDFSTCDDCTKNFPCGWCGDTGTCDEGSRSGPDAGSCADWSWIVNQCTATDPCAAATTCGGCAGVSGCGWCESTGRCVEGAASGPTAGSCGDWSFGAAACSCSMTQGPCNDFSDCCSGLSCRDGATFSQRCCQERGRSCTVGGDCCGYMDCVGGTCVCRERGRACLDARDCCSGMCDGGRCL